jgi:hypothetical protein
VDDLRHWKVWLLGKQPFERQRMGVHLSARSGLYVEGQRASRRAQYAGRVVPENDFHAHNM